MKYAYKISYFEFCYIKALIIIMCMQANSDSLERDKPYFAFNEYRVQRMMTINNK